MQVKYQSITTLAYAQESGKTRLKIESTIEESYKVICGVLEIINKKFEYENNINY